MKKLNIIAIMVALAFLSYVTADACTNLMVTKGASADGSTMVTYNADAGGFFEELVYIPHATWEEGAMLKIYDWDSGKYLGEIPQIPETYRVVSHMNEYQVSIGETTFGGRKELHDTTGIMDYGSLIRVTLTRAKTAREAIKIIDNLVQTYGYYSSGESFSICDPNEVWFFEIISKGMEEKGAVWVARRVPDGMIAAHANQSRITTFPLDDPENCMYSPDVITFAEKMGYYNKKEDGEFSFMDAYNPLDPGGALYCEGRVWSIFDRAAPSLELNTDYWRAVKGAEPYPLWIKPDKKLTVQDAISLMRDHFEGTEWDMTKGIAAGPYGCPYRWKGLVWGVEGDTVTKYGWGRPVSTQQTCFAFVAQMRSYLPNEIGGVFWYGVDDNYSNVYIPMYNCLKKSPNCFTGHGIDDFSLESGWWVFNLVSNLAYTKYEYAIKDIQEVQSELENGFAKMQPMVEKTAKELYKQDPQLAIDYLHNYSTTQAEMTVNRWRELWKFMVMKYNDGYINDVKKDNGRHPASSYYPEWFKRQVLEEKGEDYYKLEFKEPNKKKGKK